MTAVASGHAAARLADDVEASAFIDLYAAAPAPLRQQLGLQVHPLPGATALLAPGLPTPMFNRVIGFGMGHPATAERLRVAQCLYRDAGVANWWLHWNPWASPPGFTASLHAAGFTSPSRRSWAKVLRGAEPAPPVASDLAVAPVPRDRVDEVCACIAQAFGMPAFMADWLAALDGRPRWRLVAARDGDRIVGGGCLYLDGAHAWLGMGSVVESHRRRGGQQALLARRIEHAIDAGCRAIVSETGEPIADEPTPSLANLLRCGFTVVASRLNLQAPR